MVGAGSRWVSWDGDVLRAAMAKDKGYMTMSEYQAVKAQAKKDASRASTRSLAAYCLRTERSSRATARSLHCLCVLVAILPLALRFSACSRRCLVALRVVVDRAERVRHVPVREQLEGGGVRAPKLLRDRRGVDDLCPRRASTSQQ